MYSQFYHRNKRVLITIIIIFFLLFYILAANDNAEERKVTIFGSELSIKKGFIINEIFYAITRDGKLYAYEDGNRTITHVFPTSDVAADLKEGTIYYLNQNYIWGYSVYTDMANKVAPIKYNAHNNMHDEILFISAENIFIKIDENKCLKYSLEECIFSEIPDCVIDYITIDEERVYYPIGNDIFCYDIIQEEEYLVVKDQTNNYIIAATAQMNDLYYVRTDGIIRHAKIGPHDSGNSSLWEYKYNQSDDGSVIAISCIEKGIVVAKMNRTNKTFIIEKVIDNQVVEEKIHNEVLYTIPGSCKLCCTDKMYACFSSSSKQVIMGQFVL